VTIPTLRAELKTPVWDALDDENSVLCKILKSTALKNPKHGQSKDQIDNDWLICLGLLHCTKENHQQQKATVFYDIVEEGGLETHRHITAADKDMNPAIHKICEFATINLYEWMRDYAEFKIPYSEAHL